MHAVREFVWAVARGWVITMFSVLAVVAFIWLLGWPAAWIVRWAGYAEEMGLIESRFRSRGQVANTRVMLGFLLFMLGLPAAWIVWKALH